MGGEVRLYNDQFERTATYPFDPRRSALAAITSRNDNVKLMRFKHSLGGLSCFRINPFQMNPSSAKEEQYARVDLTNFASWYRHRSLIDPMHVEGLTNDMREALGGFKYLRFMPPPENSRLAAEFDVGDGVIRSFAWNELPEGQRCLIALYAVLHFVLLTQAGTVIFDEPDNFIFLREIEPWLMAI